MAEHPRIQIDPDVLLGKPVVAGTRIAVERVVALLAEGWSEAQVLENHPRLTTEDIRACIQRA
jgi:uncharacterized protein (DUF433 family)